MDGMAPLVIGGMEDTTVESKGSNGTDGGDEGEKEPGWKPGAIPNVAEMGNVRPSMGMKDNGVSTVDRMAPLPEGQALGTLSVESGRKEADCSSSTLPGLISRERDVVAFGAPACVKEDMGCEG